MEDLQRTRDVGEYSYSLTLRPDDGLNGTVRMEIPNGGALAIRTPKNWLFRVTENATSGRTEWSFAAPDEDEPHQLHFTATSSSTSPHVRIPPLEPQRIARDILSGTAIELARGSIRQFYRGAHPLDDYSSFLKDCRYMLNHSEYLRLMNLIATDDAQFKSNIIGTQTHWFANRMVTKATKYPIRTREALDDALAEYREYESLLDLELTEIEEAYFEKYRETEEPMTNPEDFGFASTPE